ncbi:hypothetical protein [Actinoplanes palleronii]|uniref:Excreted virulence factor EspC (Type VII ESX diderm) n=1 Tax=Actinoplanes palleronii TaxID=113570 RepID=A0ABQ4B8F7_9ACTN|nr:hypothetical protein [Actinoplanes palleronii]GIE66882.1 hypothetical protein Apa02nite_029900 [Actinoplanes palleronii]
MNPDLDVDADQLRQAAASITGTAARVREAAAVAPGPIAGPRWVTTDAATTAADAAETRLRELSADLSAAGQLMEETLSAYAEADARAAARLRSTR